MHSYSCYVPQAIIYVGVKNELQPNSNVVFGMIEQNIYFKSGAIEETLIELIRFNVSISKKVICETFLVSLGNASFVCMKCSIA